MKELKEKFFSENAHVFKLDSGKIKAKWIKDAWEVWQFIEENFVLKSENEKQKEKVKNEPINFFLSNILTHCSQEEIKELTGKLVRRTTGYIEEPKHKTELLKLSSELSACQLALASLQKKYLEDVERPTCDTCGNKVTEILCTKNECKDYSHYQLKGSE